MKNRLMQSIFASAIVLVLCTTPVVPEPRPDGFSVPREAATETVELIDLLPESTVLAVEIRNVAKRWIEIRSIPAIGRLQDRLLAGSELAPDDLPRLAGDRAVVALVTAEDGRSVIPVALLRPAASPAEAAAILERAGVDGGALMTRHGRGVLWIGPSEASRRLDELATGDGTSPRQTLMMDEVSRRLPDGGLVRGWIDPVALRTLLRDHVEGTEPLPVELLRTVVAAELDAVRFMGFRRELTSDGVIADAVIGLEPAVLPAEIARVFGSSPDSPPLLPSPLPPVVVLGSSFGIEAEALLAWVGYVATADPRGPLRNLDFWMGEFQERTGRDLERDLVAALGERGWFFLLTGDTSQRLQALLIFETRDAGRLEQTLVDLRSWLVEQARGRTLGVVVPRIHDDSLNQMTVHGLTLRTPFAEVPGPAFLVNGEHLLVGTGRAALNAGLELLSTKGSWAPTRVMPDNAVGALEEWSGEEIGPAGQFPHESIRVQGSALSRWVHAVVDPDAQGPAGHLAPALACMLADLESISGDVWYQEDAVRIHGRVRFDIEETP